MTTPRLLVELYSWAWEASKREAVVRLAKGIGAELVKLKRADRPPDPWPDEDMGAFLDRSGEWEHRRDWLCQIGLMVDEMVSRIEGTHRQHVFPQDLEPWEQGDPPWVLHLKRGLVAQIERMSDG